MSRGAFPRLAKLLYYRGSSGSPVVLVTRINEGPQSEIGRHVNVPLTKADLPVLREVIEKLEQS